MKKRYSVFFIFLTISLLFSACATTGSSARVTPIETSISAIDKYGNSPLAISEEAFWATSLEAGDIVSINIGSAKVEAPVCTNYSDVENGKVLVRVNGDVVSLSINMGNFAKTYNAEVGTPVVISLAKKAGYLTEYQVRQLTKSENRNDYVSDEVFANFRAVKAGKIASNRLYRCCNPLYGDARAPYAEKLIKQAAIKTAINLADSDEGARSHFKEAPYYASIAANGNAVFLNMGVSFTDTDFITKLHDGLVFLSEHPEGPYVVHCNEGKDRAGFVNALLAALNGATMDEMIADYMLSFENYFGVKKGTEQYTLIGQTIPDMFKTINGNKAVTDKNLAKVAENYVLNTVKITKDQLEAIRKNLQ